MVDKGSGQPHETVPSLCVKKDGGIDIMAVWRLSEMDSMSVKPGRLRISVEKHAPPLPRKFHGENSPFIAVCRKTPVDK